MGWKKKRKKRRKEKRLEYYQAYCNSGIAEISNIIPTLYFYDNSKGPAVYMCAQVRWTQEPDAALDAALGWVGLGWLGWVGLVLNQRRLRPTRRREKKYSHPGVHIEYLSHAPTFFSFFFFRLASTFQLLLDKAVVSGVVPSPPSICIHIYIQKIYVHKLKHNVNWKTTKSLGSLRAENSQIISHPFTLSRGRKLCLVAVLGRLGRCAVRSHH